MPSIPKIVGIISCGMMLCFGLTEGVVALEIRSNVLRILSRET